MGIRAEVHTSPPFPFAQDSYQYQRIKSREKNFLLRRAEAAPFELGVDSSFQGIMIFRAANFNSR
jgi:hypothetical protein